MKIKTADLKRALEQVKPGLATKELIEQSTHFAFLNDRIVTFSDEISISYPLKGLGLNITGAIKAEEFYDIISKIETDEIEIDVTESEIRIASGKAKAGVTLQQEVKLPLDEVGKMDSWQNIPEKFIEALKFAVFSCSKDVSHPALTCINITEEGNIESSDDQRITRYKVKNMPVPTFLIPAKSVRELVKYNFNQISAGGAWVHFKSDEGTVFSCRIYIDEKFPEITKLLKVKGPQLKLPKTIERILDRATVFSKGTKAIEGEEVSVSLTTNKIKITSRGDYGWFEEEANMAYTGTPIGFSVNPTLLKDIIEEMRICTLGENSIKFESENWEHLICLYADEAK